jgi:hypothetical protein
MKKLFVAITALFMFASCSKDKDQTGSVPTANSKKLVKTEYSFNNGPTEGRTFSYDPQGRVSVITEVNRRYEFDYQSARFVKVKSIKTSDNSLTETIELDLNDKGEATQVIYKNLLDVMTYRYQYIYNTDGYVVGIKGSETMDEDYEEKLTVVNGNVVSSKVYYSGVLPNTKEFTYDTRANKTPFSFHGIWPVNTMFGKPSTNHRIEYKDLDENGAIVWHTKTAHELDVNGYDWKATTTNVLDGKTSLYTSTYE